MPIPSGSSSFNPDPHPGCLHYFKAAFGSVLIGVTLPCLLVGLRMLNKSMLNNLDRLISNALGLMALATMFCGPGAVLLSIMLLALLASPAKESTLQQTVVAGVLGGIAMAFLNVPGYLVVGLLEHETFVYARAALLFVVAGASCGLWIAWLAWRACHPSERSRFSLGTLMLLVLLWGSVMVVFQPRAWGSELPLGNW